MKIIDLLTNPTTHGGNASDVFNLVIPSMPGYGYSGKPTTTGWDLSHIARAWVVLMSVSGTRNSWRKAAIGCGHHGTNGPAGASGIARHSHQHAWHLSRRY